MGVGDWAAAGLEDALTGAENEGDELLDAAEDTHTHTRTHTHAHTHAHTHTHTTQFEQYTHAIDRSIN